MYLQLWYLGEHGENEFGPPARHEAAAGARAGAAGDIEGVGATRRKPAPAEGAEAGRGDGVMFQLIQGKWGTHG